MIPVTPPGQTQESQWLQIRQAKPDYVIVWTYGVMSTVSLKTAGLLVLMAQSGLPVPCAEAELPVFEQVLADIGDNQSIHASLSTFSSHISRIREMVLDETPDSLTDHTRVCCRV